MSERHLTSSAFAGPISDHEHQTKASHPDRGTAEMSRRGLLGAAAGTFSLVMAPSLWLPQGAAAVTASSLTGSKPLRLAMHVHGSWSEGAGSWEAQFQQAAANNIDVLYLTDHDHRLTAYGYAKSLAQATFVSSSSGSFRQKAMTHTGGSLRLLAESASTTAPATVTMAMQDRPFCFEQLRTSIAGLTITQKIASIHMTGSARYEVVIELSYHPARSGRPAGQYRLVYRFGGTFARWTEQQGLVGYVRMPMPTAGSTQVLRPEQDVAALWPDMLAIDNNHYGMSFVVRSPARGQVGDVTIGSMTFARSQASPSAAMANQARVVKRYAGQYPSVAGRRQVEYSRTVPHVSSFGMPQWVPNQAALPDDNDARLRRIVNTAHGMGGLVSWNHPFGYNGPPLLPPTELATKRRSVFRSMQAVGRFGVDILEVGYSLRGNADAGAHLDLWDTFSRNGNFLTGNGTTDDHSGEGWNVLDNGFATGVWAASRTEADLKQALRAGRAYAAHIGRWRGGKLDMLVDDTVPMGGISVSGKSSRRLTIYASNLPGGAIVQLVAGPVDYAGAVDPGTVVVHRFGASSFSNDLATVTVDTSTSKFYRATVRLADGTIVGTGNPVWLLRTAPPDGVPVARS